MNTGTAVVGVALIGAVAVVGYMVWKKSQTTISVGAGGVDAQIGATATQAGLKAVSSLGTSLGNALAGGIGSLFNGGGAQNTDSETYG
jgi:predicted negative regulator of RcsB-dependent stress response